MLFHDDDDCLHPQALEYATYLIKTQTADVHVFNYIFNWNGIHGSPFCPIKDFTSVSARTTDLLQ